MVEKMNSLRLSGSKNYVVVLAEQTGKFPLNRSSEELGNFCASLNFGDLSWPAVRRRYWGTGSLCREPVRREKRTPRPTSEPAMRTLRGA